MRTEYEEVKEILVKHDVDLDGDVDKFMETIIYGEPLFQELFEYFMGEGEMPYDVAKGRADVMSDEWIVDRIQEIGLIKGEQNDPNGLPLDFTNRYHREQA
jgi:hypothetical protein